MLSASCGRPEDTSQHTYRIGFGGDKPLHYAGPDGKPTGLAVAVVSAAARHRGIRLEWIQSVDALEDLQARRIDLFVLLAALPERRKLVYLSAPYLASESAFMVPDESPYKVLQDLANARVAFNNVAVQRMTLAQQLPGSTPVPLSSTADALRAMQDGRAEAAYVDQYAGIVGLLDGAATRHLRIIASALPMRPLALGANFESQTVAEDLRDEIARMSDRQELAKVLANWSMFPVLMAGSAEALNEARMKVRWLGAGATVLGFFLISVVLLLRRLRHRTDSLQESEIRFRSLAETAFEGVLTHDGERILDANLQCARLFGYETIAEIIALSGVAMLIDKESRARVQGRSMSDGLLEPIELTGIRKDGTKFQIETQGCKSAFRGRRVRVVAMRDISERKRAEEERGRLETQLVQAQKIESIGRLAGGVAHDFNNLLTVINGYSALTLLDRGVTGELRKRTEQIRKAGERAAELTAQLLAFGRKQVIQPRPLDLNGLVNDLQAMLTRVMRKNIAIVCCLEENLSRVQADPGQIHQVLMNLAVNAGDAMPNGGTLILETRSVVLDSQYTAEHPEVVEGPCVMLAVTDNGIGMTPETLKQVFEPFFTTKPMGVGTGLGLSTVYGIVHQSGGWVWAYSEPGKGTSFKIYLPVLTDKAPMRVPEVQVHPHRGNETVLVVEDETQISNLVGRVLEGKGYRVLRASNADEAQAVAAEMLDQIDLLLTDVVLPGISGKELADILKARRPELKVLYMSGYTENVMVNRGVLQQDIQFLPKPLTPDSLLEKVAQVLGAVGKLPGGIE
ncbi:MAG TPA: ATP-binding protein [Bryobacteraceae bacterium]|nr:ATP-binding protein [Bryobacteraceae bacterium]